MLLAIDFKKIFSYNLGRAGLFIRHFYGGGTGKVAQKMEFWGKIEEF